jgi:hypothetical protein
MGACDEHLNTLSPYVADQISNIDSKKFDFILEYQEKLLTIILPTLSEKTS